MNTNSYPKLRLIEQKILLPRATVLERLIAWVRERAAQRLYERLVSLLSLRQQIQLQKAIRLFDVRLITLDHLPINRLQSIYHYACSAAMTTLRNLKPDRRLATMLVMLHFLEGTAQGDGIDVFEQLM